MNRLTHTLLHLFVAVTLLVAPVQVVFAMSMSGGDTQPAHHHGTSAADADAGTGMASDSEATHDCDCCPPGSCHSMAAKCKSGQCGSCAASVLAAGSARPNALPAAPIPIISPATHSLRPDTLYRPPRA